MHDDMEDWVYFDKDLFGYEIPKNIEESDGIPDAYLPIALKLDAKERKQLADLISDRNASWKEVAELSSAKQDAKLYARRCKLLAYIAGGFIFLAINPSFFTLSTLGEYLSAAALFTLCGFLLGGVLEGFLQLFFRRASDCDTILYRLMFAAIPLLAALLRLGN